jgi:hypothetical protein
LIPLAPAPARTPTLSRALALGLALALAPVPALAQTAPPDSDAALAERLAAFEREVPRGSVRDLALAVAERVAGDLGEGRVGLSIRVEGGADPTAFARALRPALAHALHVHAPGAAPLRLSRAAATAEAAALASARAGDQFHLDVLVEPRSRAVRVACTVFASRAGGLAALHAPAPERVTAVALSRLRAADLARYVGPLPRLDDETVTVLSADLPTRGYAAVLDADLDGDGRPEIVLARGDRVDAVLLAPSRSARSTVARHVGTGAVRDVPLSPIPSRRSFGTAVRAERGVLFRLSDHAGPFRVVRRIGRRLEIDSEPATPCASAVEFPLDDACASFVTGRDWLAAELLGRDGGAAPDPTPAGFYARVSTSVRQADGSDASFEALVTPRGRLGTRVADRRAGLVDVGAALAMADVDGDGAAELLVSAAHPIGEGDRLRLLRLRPDGALHSVWESAAIEGSVMLAGAGDVDGDGAPELYAVEEPASDNPNERARLWVVR